MIIRPYGNLPRTYAADVGEVVRARLSISNPYTRAVITNVSRRRNGSVRYDFVWLDTQESSSAVAGERSHVYATMSGPPLIEQIDNGRRAAASGPGTEPGGPGSGSSPRTDRP